MALDNKRIAIFIIIAGGALGIVLFLRFGKDIDTQVPIVEERQENSTGEAYDGELVAGSTIIPITIADTEEERQLGLSNTYSLTPKTGKLFVFPEAGLYGFWMKDMNYPIDMVWIDENMKVVGVSENVDPSTYPQAFYPPEKIQFVLEVNAHEARSLSLIPNTTLTLKKEF